MYENGFSSAVVVAGARKATTLDEGVKDNLEEMLGRQMGPVEGRHLSLEELERLAARRRGGEEMELPGHLTGCPVCLELYEVVLEGVPAVSDESVERFVEIYGAKEVGIRGRIGWRTWAGVAAVLVVCIGLAGVYIPMGRTTSVAGAEGLIREDGHMVAVGASIPAGTGLVAKEETKAGFADGSSVVIGKGTQLAIAETNLGSKTVTLTQGHMEASVAKQTWGRKFEVATPLGPVTVVGTKFSVTCGKERVVVYENGIQKQNQMSGEEITVVTVRVTEGVVRVSNKSEEVRVSAGEAAVMREHEPRIELGSAGIK